MTGNYLGTAADLGVPVVKDIDPTQVEIYDDMTHVGPCAARRTGELVKILTDYQMYFVYDILCPCGHYLRSGHKPDPRYSMGEWQETIECIGHISLPETPVRTQQASLDDVAADGRIVGDEQ